MNVSIKSKFSVIIIFMSVLSLILAYIISSEIVYSNLKDEYISHIEEKKDYQLIKDWYEAHSDVKQRPALQFPVDILWYEGTVQTIADKEAMKV